MDRIVALLNQAADATRPGQIRRILDVGNRWEWLRALDAYDFLIRLFRNPLISPQSKIRWTKQNRERLFEGRIPNLYSAWLYLYWDAQRRQDRPLCLMLSTFQRPGRYGKMVHVRGDTEPTQKIAPGTLKHFQQLGHNLESMIYTLFHVQVPLVNRSAMRWYIGHLMAGDVGTIEPVLKYPLMTRYSLLWDEEALMIFLPASCLVNLLPNTLFHSFWRPYCISPKMRRNVLFALIVFVTDGHVRADASPIGRFFRMCAGLPYELQVMVAGAAFGQRCQSVPSGEFQTAATWAANYLVDSYVWLD